MWGCEIALKALTKYKKFYLIGNAWKWEEKGKQAKFPLWLS